MMARSAWNSSAVRYGFCGGSRWRAASPPVNALSVAASREYIDASARRYGSSSRWLSRSGEASASLRISGVTFTSIAEMDSSRPRKCTSVR
jgi:hypothetical protein